MPKSKGSRGKLVEDGWITRLIIASVISLWQQVELVQVDCVPAEDTWQELVPRDVGHLGHEDPPRLVVQLLVGPLGVELGESVGQPVVLPHEDGVDGRQDRLFTAPGIASLETQSSS